MKNALYVIAGLLVVIWAIVYFGFYSSSINSFSIIHVLLILAVGIILFRLIFNKRLSRAPNKEKTQ